MKEKKVGLARSPCISGVEEAIQHSFELLNRSQTFLKCLKEKKKMITANESQAPVYHFAGENNAFSSAV